MFFSFPICHWSNSSLIKSIQTGSITIAANASSNTATITSVNTASSVVLYNGFRTANASAMDASQQYPRLVLTNATTVTANTAAADVSNVRIIQYTVIEFQPWCIRSIQTGTIVLNSVTSNTATISAVTTANSFVVFQGQTHSTNTADYNYTQGALTLTNTTTVTATKGSGATNALTVGYAVIEFVTNIVRTIQQVSATIAGSSASQTATISAVTTNNSWTVNNGWNMASFATNDPTRVPYTVLTNSTTVTFSRNSSASATTVPCACTIVEFNSRYIKSRASGQINIGASNVSNTATISAVNTAKTIVSWLGFQDNTNDTANPATTYPTATLTNSTTVTIARNTATTSQVINSWEAIEFV